MLRWNHNSTIFQELLHLTHVVRRCIVFQSCSEADIWVPIGAQVLRDSRLFVAIEQVFDQRVETRRLPRLSQSVVGLLRVQIWRVTTGLVDRDVLRLLFLDGTAPQLILQHKSLIRLL